MLRRQHGETGAHIIKELLAQHRLSIPMNVKCLADSFLLEDNVLFSFFLRPADKVNPPPRDPLSIYSCLLKALLGLHNVLLYQLVGGSAHTHEEEAASNRARLLLKKGLQTSEAHKWTLYRTEGS